MIFITCPECHKHAIVGTQKNVVGGKIGFCCFCKNIIQLGVETA